MKRAPGVKDTAPPDQKWTNVWKYDKNVEIKQNFLSKP